MVPGTSASAARGREEELRLIRAARDGDGTAYGRLVTPLLPALHDFIRHELRSRPDLEPDDALQTALVTGWKALERYLEQYSFRSYIFGIARQTAFRFTHDIPVEVTIDWGEEGGRPVGEPPPSTYEEIDDRLAPIVGTKRFRRPDAGVEPLGVFREMLEAMLWYGGYPHQQVAFGYSIVLWGKRKEERRARGASAARLRGLEEEVLDRASEKVPITGDPDRVVRELSDAALRESTAEFRSELEGRDYLREDALDTVFEPLDYRLGLKGQALFARDQTSAEAFRHLRDSLIARTVLKEYFGKDPRKSIADWTNTVKRRTREAFLGELDPSRSPLPWPEGHENRRSAP